MTNASRSSKICVCDTGNCAGSLTARTINTIQCGGRGRERLVGRSESRRASFSGYAGALGRRVRPHKRYIDSAPERYPQRGPRRNLKIA